MSIALSYTASLKNAYGANRLLCQRVRDRQTENNPEKRQTNRNTDRHRGRLGWPWFILDLFFKRKNTMLGITLLGSLRQFEI